MVDAWSSNDELVAGGAQRRGYMGHLTKICNDILASADKGPYSSLVSTLLTGWYNCCVSDLKSGSAIISHDRSLSTIHFDFGTCCLYPESQLHKSLRILQYYGSAEPDLFLAITCRCLFFFKSPKILSTLQVASDNKYINGLVIAI